MFPFQNGYQLRRRSTLDMLYIAVLPFFKISNIGLKGESNKNINQTFWSSCYFPTHVFFFTKVSCSWTFQFFGDYNDIPRECEKLSTMYGLNNLRGIYFRIAQTSKHRQTESFFEMMPRKKKKKKTYKTL